MTQRDVLEAGRHTIMIALQLSLPVLLCALIAGVLVSIFQAVTQIQEFTLTFVPKLAGIAIVLVVAGSWMLHQLVTFTNQLFERVPELVR